MEEVVAMRQWAVCGRPVPPRLMLLLLVVSIAGNMLLLFQSTRSRWALQDCATALTHFIKLAATYEADRDFHSGRARLYVAEEGTAVMPEKTDRVENGLSVWRNCYVSEIDKVEMDLYVQTYNETIRRLGATESAVSAD